MHKMSDSQNNLRFSWVICVLLSNLLCMHATVKLHNGYLSGEPNNKYFVYLLLSYLQWNLLFDQTSL